MTISIKHKFVNPKSDTADATVSRASNWNDEHDITLAQNRVLGRVSAANGPVEELTGEQIRTLSETTQSGVLAGVNTRTASYSLVASDRGKIVEMNVASANTVTVPNEASLGGVNYPIGTQIAVVQIGLGQTTVIPALGVNLQAAGNGSKTTTRYSGVFLYKRGPNDWIALDQPYANAGASAAAVSATEAAASAALAGDRADDIAALASFRDYANLATLLANTSLTYTAGQPLTVVPNEIIRTRDRGYAYKVAASAATDHHFSTAGGIKLYVLPGQSGYDVKAFGAVGDGVADDTAEIQAAFDALDPVRGGVLVFPAGRYKISNTITLPRTTSGTGVYEIYGYGARIETTAAIKMFERTVANNTVANQIIGDRFVFAGLEFYGNQQSAQWGIKLGATYGSVLRECRFFFLGTGLDLLFCLNATVEQCFTTFCVNDAFVARSGDWTGAGLNNSQSNVSVFRNCRDYGATGQNASYKILSSSGVLIENCISEGFDHAYGVYFDYQSSTTVKNFFVRNFHCEHTPTIAGCRVVAAGIAEIDGWWQQTLGVMVDSTGTTASGLLVVRNLAYTAGGAVFTHGGTTARWLFQNCSVGDPYSAAKWTDGTSPTNLQQIAGVAQPAFSDNFLSLYGLNGIMITSKNAPLVIESDAKAISTNLHVAATTLGSVVARLALRDSATNAVVGYVPIYNTIT